ncbi:translation initiation factor IF-3 [Colletotrichum graminicola]|uniref:Translation initiation factor IF-3 n=1 Tax=Colletotrichum graminicola (strain M1.001 / M2 / FGSC 10212) TaxID=645133 RepID=E3QG41_COLGM|nr:translation initiation factor IF-3 [Colletotrichum graminicola M1.001]EFQ29876.1 translation initiation factor IF-3 [Colletotrichum graminicola M1.001]WDK12297.1 translation initiation factor IF-3 [Colletotrichum graminicola]
MSGTRCLYNYSRATLYRVFVSPFEKVEALARRSALAHPAPRTLPPVLSPPMQSFARHAALIHRPRKPSRSAEPEPKAARRLPFDEMIRDRQILVVDEDNKLTGPHNTSRVLQSLDLDTQSLRMVSRPPPNPTGDQPRYAICRVIDKRLEKEREKEQEKAKKETARRLARIKELELNWAIASHDLGHKMRQLKGFLEKGYKVDVIFAKKRGSRVATLDEAEALVKAVRDVVAEVRGAKEWKEAEGQPPKVMRLYLEAPPSAKAPSKSSAVNSEPSEN